MTATERQQLRELAADLAADIAFERSLAELTTWRIGGPADAVIEPRTRDAVEAVVAHAAGNDLPCRVIGNGSNLLCPDEGVRGIVLELANALADTTVDDLDVTVEAGVFLPRLSRQVASLGLTGLEGMVGVPGTVGGGCVLNAGIPSGTIGDVLVSVDVLRPDGQVEAIPRDDLGLAHRESRLQHEDGIVLSARLRLERGDRDAIESAMAEHMAYRRKTQPLGLPSCGSVFRRPAEGYPGKLIEDAGCKGLRIGDAEVSTLHANWIINRGTATAADVRRLMDTIRDRVRDQFGVELTAEVIVWGSDR